MMTIRQAACSCGQLSLRAKGEPVRISVCHCLACQKRTGSHYGAQARFPAKHVEIMGDSTAYIRTAESGNQVTFHFCPQCGATVYFLLDSFPGMIAVPVGAFADPRFPAPRISIYEVNSHDWIQFPVEIAHYD